MRKAIPFTVTHTPETTHFFVKVSFTIMTQQNYTLSLLGRIFFFKMAGQVFGGIYSLSFLTVRAVRVDSTLAAKGTSLQT